MERAPEKEPVCLTFWDFMPNSHFTQTTASPIYKTTFPKWQQQRVATSPLLGSVPQRQLQQGGDGSEKIDLGEDWLVLWTCAGGRVLCSFLSLSLCNHSSLPSLAWEIQTSKAAIPLQHYSWVEPIPIALHWALPSAEAFGSGQKGWGGNQFLHACSSRSVSGLPGSSLENLSVMKIQFVSPWTFTQAQTP